MDFEAIFARWLPLLKKYWLALALFLAGLIFFAYGLIAFFGSNSKSSELTFHSNSSQTNANTAVKTQNLMQVDIEGAVISPGVYRLPADSIIKDALVSAGGLSSQADRDFVAKNINLAAKLSDGAKIYIPKIGEATSSDSQIPGVDTQALATININTASSDDLDSLPGVGPATVTKIVNGRPYSNINELLDKKIVSSKVFGEIKDKISVY